eukprot:TRINITY_DN12332_c0_g1_i1.p1 TRINITY_DN12332_c0_g1~~TRINITY_DN12332_c0_g1_i1.p1  ORF type:complete len:434 (+),score=83.00 TRINITY_DN12332_c0_g1_i1:56-1357(+)
MAAPGSVRGEDGRHGCLKTAAARRGASPQPMNDDFEFDDWRRRRRDDLEKRSDDAQLGACTSCCMTLISLTFSGIGLAMLLSSASNDREAKVSDYDAAVRNWAERGRSALEGASFTVSAQWRYPDSAANASAEQFWGPPGSAEVQMAVVTEDEDKMLNASDSEGGAGTLAYAPLRYRANLKLPAYYDSSTAAGQAASEAWTPLPSKPEAPVLQIAISAANKDGATSSFHLHGVPLHYDQVVQSRTPAPENKCRGEQRGTWRANRCHIVRRLASMCMQVERSEADGAWKLHDAVASEEGSAASSRAAQALVLEPVGCDPLRNWEPANYVVDSCWGPMSLRRRCEASAAVAHSVDITIRSWEDPFIRAEVLTEDSFDFGLSSASQRLGGGLFLCIGLCLSLPVLFRFIKWRRKQQAPEEKRSLSHHQEATCIGKV